MPQCLTNLPQLESKLKFVNNIIHNRDLTNFVTLIDETKPFTPYASDLMGAKKPVTYLVLLENEYEMRANGGFFGSYAVITHTPSSSPPSQGEKCGSLPCEGEGSGWGVRFQDIYVPDGQIAGHVDPPAPIQTAFKQGWFRLRDADWEPDFPTAATTIRWFFDKGGEINPDFLVTLNLSTIKKIMAITGDISLPDYRLTINQDNLYSLLQSQSEIGFFPGSTQKHDVLTAVGKALFNKLNSLGPKQYLAIANILLDQLNKENILINAQDPTIQNVIVNQNWAGQILNVKCKILNCLNDTYLLVETNMGANKANCCTDRLTKHTITSSDNFVHHLVNLTFTNNSPLENPSPPRFYGGNYISYLRFYIPPNAENIQVSAHPTLPKTLTEYPKPFFGNISPPPPLNLRGGPEEVIQTPRYGFTEIGFFHLTAAGTQSTVDISYDLPKGQTYQLNLLKQHGFETSPQEINLFGKNYSTNLESNYSLSTTAP